MADALPEITQSLVYSVIAAIAAFLAISILLAFLCERKRARRRLHVLAKSNKVGCSRHNLRFNPNNFASQACGPLVGLYHWGYWALMLIFGSSAAYLFASLLTKPLPEDKLEKLFPRK